MFGTLQHIVNTQKATKPPFENLAVSFNLALGQSLYTLLNFLQRVLNFQWILVNLALKVKHKSQVLQLTTAV